jgi:hypothetical protein
MLRSSWGPWFNSQPGSRVSRLTVFVNFLSSFNETMFYRVSQKSLCTYTTNDKTASFLTLMFVNWHSRQASRTATHAERWRSICTCTPTRWHLGMNWKKATKWSVLNTDLVTQLLPMETIFWTSHFLVVRCDFIYPATSTAQTAAFGQRLFRMKSRINNYILRNLLPAAPCHEIGQSAS